VKKPIATWQSMTFGRFLPALRRKSAVVMTYVGLCGQMDIVLTEESLRQYE